MLRRSESALASVVELRVAAHRLDAGQLVDRFDPVEPVLLSSPGANLQVLSFPEDDDGHHAVREVDLLDDVAVLLSESLGSRSMGRKQHLPLEFFLEVDDQRNDVLRIVLALAVVRFAELLQSALIAEDDTDAADCGRSRLSQVVQQNLNVQNNLLS